ncbi:MAG: dTDP-4-dehydrorhamnose 3,5-epimerase [Pseudomonadota bacterium]
MKVTETALPGVLLLEPRRHGDARGFFSESWNRRTLAQHGITIDFVQDNHSMSDAAGTLRGLHFQSPPSVQAKLVRCGRGALYDVAVDIRNGSPTYGQSVGFELSFDNGLQLLIPEGFAHGFVTRVPQTEIIYKCSGYYDAAADSALAWDSCGIDWGLTQTPILSDKDKSAPAFAEFQSPFTWTGAA